MEDPVPRFRSIWHSSAGRAGNHEGTDGPWWVRPRVTVRDVVTELSGP